MPLMNGPKRIRRIQSITRQTRVYAIMGGLAPQTGIPNAVRSHIQLRAKKFQNIPQPGLEDLAGLRYMQQHRILSKNPACSGGIARRNAPCNLGLRW
jgi:hypothetical protein